MPQATLRCAPAGMSRAKRRRLGGEAGRTRRTTSWMRTRRPASRRTQSRSRPGDRRLAKGRGPQQVDGARGGPAGRRTQNRGDEQGAWMRSWAATGSLRNLGRGKAETPLVACPPCGGQTAVLLSPGPSHEKAFPPVRPCRPRRPPGLSRARAGDRPRGGRAHLDDLGGGGPAVGATSPFRPLRFRLIFYPPVYPYFIGATYALFGSLTAVKVCQAVLSVAARSCRRPPRGPRLRALRRDRRRRHRRLLPELVWFSVHFWSETLFMVLLWWSLERLVAAEDAGTRRRPGRRPPLGPRDPDARDDALFHARRRPLARLARRPEGSVFAPRPSSWRPSSWSSRGPRATGRSTAPSSPSRPRARSTSGRGTRASRGRRSTTSTRPSTAGSRSTTTRAARGSRRSASASPGGSSRSCGERCRSSGRPTACRWSTSSAVPTETSRRATGAVAAVIVLAPYLLVLGLFAWGVAASSVRAAADPAAALPRLLQRDPRGDPRLRALSASRDARGVPLRGVGLHGMAVARRPAPRREATAARPGAGPRARARAWRRASPPTGPSPASAPRRSRRASRASSGVARGRRPRRLARTFSTYRAGAVLALDEARGRERLAPRAASGAASAWRMPAASPSAVGSTRNARESSRSCVWVGMRVATSGLPEAR